MSTYVYGITRSSHPRLPEETVGIGDPPRPVRSVTAGRLAALVSDAPPDLRPKRRELLAHQGVLAEASSAGPVLPMRFGGVSPDDDAVTTALAAHEEHYLERLKTLDGKAEYNVKATHDEEAVLHRVLIDAPELRELREANKAAGGGSQEDRLRLGELVATAVQEREPRDAALLHHALEGAAEDACPGPPSGGWLANISFLVDREHGEEFVAAVAALRHENPHLVLRVNGPLPPYSFVD